MFPTMPPAGHQTPRTEDRPILCAHRTARRRTARRHHPWVVRAAAYASHNGGRPPPWCGRDVEIVMSLGLARRIREQVSQLGAEGGDFSIRRRGTIVLWRGGEPIGSFTLVQECPNAGSATIRRIEWDERAGYGEADVLAAIDLLSLEASRAG